MKKTLILGTWHELKGTSGLKSILKLYILFMKATFHLTIKYTNIALKALFFIKYIRRVIMADY
jgi:hypothetical protein